MSILEDLIEAKDSLTSETWGVGALFYLKSHRDEISFCSFGALEKATNPEVKEAFANPNLPHIVFVSRVKNMTAASVAHTRVSLSKDPNLNEMWEQRPNWVRFGDRDAPHYDHGYLLGMVGMTNRFNDDDNTTIEMIHDKFVAAIDLGKQLKVG